MIPRRHEDWWCEIDSFLYYNDNVVCVALSQSFIYKCAHLDLAMLLGICRRRAWGLNIFVIDIDYWLSTACCQFLFVSQFASRTTLLMASNLHREENQIACRSEWVSCWKPLIQSLMPLPLRISLDIRCASFFTVWWRPVQTPPYRAYV